MVTRLKNLFSKKKNAPGGVPLSSKPRRFDSVQSASLLKEIASSYPFLFLGYELNLPTWVKPGQNAVVHSLTNSFEFLAHVALQARVQGKRVVWVAPGRVDTDFEVINELCKSPLNLRDFEFHGPQDDAFTHKLVRSPARNTCSSNAGLVICRQEVIHRPGESQYFERLPGHFCYVSAQAQVEAEDSAPEVKASSKSLPLANTLFLFENLPLTAYQRESSRLRTLGGEPASNIENGAWLQELEQFGASWVVTTSKSLPLDSPLLAAAQVQLNAESATAVSLDLNADRTVIGSFFQVVKRQDIPQSVWSAGNQAPLLWLSEGLDKQALLLNRLYLLSPALNETFYAALDVAPEFCLGAGTQDWYYNTECEKVLLNTPQKRGPLDKSIDGITSLLAWAFDFENKSAACELAGSPQFETFVEERLSFVSRLFEAEIARRSEVTSVFSFDSLCQVFAQALNEGFVSRPLRLETSTVPPAFDSLPLRLRTLFWLEAYRSARPGFIPRARQLVTGYSANSYLGVLGVPIPEELDLLSGISNDERRVWATYFRRSRQATFSFFMSDKTNYTEILSRYRAGETVPGSLFHEIILIFDGLYGALPSATVQRT